MKGILLLVVIGFAFVGFKMWHKNYVDCRSQNNTVETCLFKF